jgi:hypothetical protein
MKTAVLWLEHRVVQRELVVSEEQVEQDRSRSRQQIELGFVSFSSYYSTLKMEAICSSEMSGFSRTTWPYNPDDRTILSHHCENLKSSKGEIVKQGTF